MYSCSPKPPYIWVKERKKQCPYFPYYPDFRWWGERSGGEGGKGKKGGKGEEETEGRKGMMVKKIRIGMEREILKKRIIDG